MTRLITNAQTRTGLYVQMLTIHYSHIKPHAVWFSPPEPYHLKYPPEHDFACFCPNNRLKPVLKMTKFTKQHGEHLTKLRQRRRMGGSCREGRAAWPHPEEGLPHTRLHQWKCTQTLLIRRYIRAIYTTQLCTTDFQSNTKERLITVFMLWWCTLVFWVWYFPNKTNIGMYSHRHIFFLCSVKNVKDKCVKKSPTK